MHIHCVSLSSSLFLSLSLPLSLPLFPFFIILLSLSHTHTLSLPLPIHSPRRVFAMMQYNGDSHEIARPSEVLSRIQSYMSALRTLELYVTIDMTRVLTAVLLQETQLLDSKGEATLASSYTSWSVCVCVCVC